MTAIEALVKAKISYGRDKQLTDLGHEMFRMYSEMGFPPDMFMDEVRKRMNLNVLQTVYLVSVYHADLLHHKRLAGATDKNIDNTRRRNRDEIDRLLTSNEIGVY